MARNEQLSKVLADSVDTPSLKTVLREAVAPAPPPRDPRPAPSSVPKPKK